MKASRSTLSLALAATLALSLGACADSSDPSTGGTNLSQVQASDLSSDVAQDLDELAELSTFDPSNGVPLAAPGTAGIHSPPQAPCATFAPNPPTNSDGDAVPDSVRFSYDACVFTRGNGAMTDSLGGTIDFLDPLPLVSSIGVRHVFTDFTRARINSMMPRRSFTAVHNGVREWGGSADTLGHTITDFVTVWTHPSGRTTTHTKNWTATFTATVPGSISLITPLPAGAFVLNGTGEWATLNRTWSVATSTVTPLAYDPTCVAAPRFTAGELRLVVTRNGEVTNVDIVFTACGQYTVTRTAGGAV